MLRNIKRKIKRKLRNVSTNKLIMFISVFYILGKFFTKSTKKLLTYICLYVSIDLWWWFYENI